MSYKRVRKRIASVVILLVYILIIIFEANQYYSYADSTPNEIRIITQMKIFQKDGSLFSFEGCGLPDNHIFECIWEFDQVSSVRKNFILLVLADYKQCYFQFDGQTVSSYRFSLDKEDSIRVPITVLLNTDKVYEYQFIAVPSPDISYDSASSGDMSDDLCRELSYTKYITILRLPTIVGAFPDYEVNSLSNDIKESFDGINIAEDPGEIIDTGIEFSSSQTVKCFLGNYDDYEPQDYLLISFLNWNQTVIGDYGLCPIFRLNPSECGYIDIQVPSVDDTAQYQVMMIHKPYQSEPDVICANSSTARAFIKRRIP